MKRAKSASAKGKSSAKKHSKKACVVQSGAKKGKLKRGWKFGKGGRCVKAKKK